MGEKAGSGRQAGRQSGPVGDNISESVRDNFPMTVRDISGTTSKAFDNIFTGKLGNTIIVDLESINKYATVVFHRAIPLY